MQKYNIDLDINISYQIFTQGSPKLIGVGDDIDYISIIDIILPSKYLNLSIGKFDIEYKDSIVNIEIKKINTKEEDLVLAQVEKLKNALKKKEARDFFYTEFDLPAEAITDNRGVYPTVAAIITFPWRIAKWIDVKHDTGLKMENDSELFQITGVDDSSEKILALIIFNRLLKLLKINDLNILTYDDITIYTERYFKIPEYSTPLIIRLNTLTAKDAYRNAVYDYLLPKLQQQEIKKSVSILKKEYTGKEISNENDLKLAISDAIKNVLKYNIELRRWVEPFWDGERTISEDGIKKIIQRMPKHEPKIQPTLHVLLDIAMLPLGIHVVRESDEGIGSLDFKFLFTTKSGVPITVGVEFKLAHHSDIEHGITKQLPAYLEAIRSNTGIFVVMWFKDPEYFNKPTKYNKNEMVEFLAKQATGICASSGMDISSVMIDASIRPSASNL